jgi:two-component system LytT family response regulator
VFLDIELGSLSAFDLLDRIREVNFSVIFTTAYEHYALRAIKFSALDFLLKPISADELKEAVNKAVRQNEKNLENKIDLLLENITRENNPKKIAIATLSGVIITDIREIIYLKSDGPGPYAKIFCRNGSEITSSIILKEYEDMLSGFGFCRIHRSALVNINEINKYLLESAGGYALMSNGHKVAISERKKKDMEEMMNRKVIIRGS